MLYQKLMKEILYAKSCYSVRDQLFQIYGRVTMARELEAITMDEFLQLNHEIVYEGINNPVYANR